MSEIEFKVLEEDELIQSSKKLELLNKELIGLKELIKSLNKSVIEEPLITELEHDLIALKNDVETAKQHLEEANKEKIRRHMVVFSGGLGSIAGGTLGMVLVPISGPLTPLITTVLGGISGVLYSLF